MLPNRPLSILVIGSGGREHALCWKLAQSPLAKIIYCAPGNGGTAITDKTKNIDIGVMDFEGIGDFCLAKNVDLVVVGPDNPLAEGITDYLEERLIRVFGPTKLAARLESSKVFAKEFMVRAGIPTARYLVCSSLDEGRKLLRENSWARVVKVDGLALGKGVFVCDNEGESVEALSSIFEQKTFGDSGARVILEERLVGDEISLLTLCDGKTIVPLLPSRDHKRRFDGDAGPNTGGMGAYAPVELYDRCRKQIEESVLQPLERAFSQQEDLLGCSFKGVLYIGLLVTAHGDKLSPQVLEFNARFGDPETQALLPLLSSDLVEALWVCTEGRLAPSHVRWSGEASCCVVAAAESYPASSSKGQAITLGELPERSLVFHAGTRLSDAQLVSNGGRVLAVTGTGRSLREATDCAYAALESIGFSDMSYRKDIAGRESETCPSA